MRHTLIGILTLSAMMFSYEEIKQLIPSTVEGIVKEAGSGAPVPDAHVHAVRGEEESLTDAKGMFRLNTWQKFPVLLTIEHKGFESQQVVIASASRKVVVQLKRKSP